MARSFEMTWIASRLRWMKMYKGVRYVISCKALGVAENKEGSYLAANEWWTKKRAEIDGVKATLPNPIIAVLEDWQGGPLTTQLDLMATMRAFVEAHRDAPIPKGVAEAVLGSEEVSRLQLKVDAILDASQAPPGRTIAAHADAWQRHQQALVAANQMTPDRCSNNRICLDHFQTFAGPFSDVDTIDAGNLQGFYLQCVGQVAARRTDTKKGWSVAYARGVFSVAKTFIRWLWEQDTIQLPKNIGSKSFKFGSGIKNIKTWTPNEYQTTVVAAPGKLKLALLLMANCGMTQGDVSDLLDTEVDWVNGRITRKRSKTSNCENVPTVCYKLWPLTFELLKKYRSGSERVLLTETGLPYVRKELLNGKLSKADGFASNFVHLKKRLKLKRPLKQLRKLGATLLESHATYGRFTSYFLGHSPRTVSAKHYSAPSQDLFDEAVTWLGQQLSMC